MNFYLVGYRFFKKKVSLKKKPFRDSIEKDQCYSSLLDYTARFYSQEGLQI